MGSELYIHKFKLLQSKILDDQLLGLAISVRIHIDPRWVATLINHSQIGIHIDPRWVTTLINQSPIPTKEK